MKFKFFIPKKYRWTKIDFFFRNTGRGQKCNLFLRSKVIVIYYVNNNNNNNDDDNNDNNNNNTRA